MNKIELTVNHYGCTIGLLAGVDTQRKQNLLIVCLCQLHRDSYETFFFNKSCGYKINNVIFAYILYLLVEKNCKLMLSLEATNSLLLYFFTSI